MTIFVASDIHFNHRNILKYCPHRRSGRPMPETDYDIANMVSDMNEKIVANWNNVVEPEDEVFILGDVAMGQIDKAPALIRRLNGLKHLIKGNHDKSLVKHINKSDGDFNSYKSLFASIHDVLEMGHKTEAGKKVSLFMSHYPHHSWNGMNQGAIMLHGHLHGSPHTVTGRIKDVGIDTNNLFPYRMDAVVEEMLKIETIRSHHDD